MTIAPGHAAHLGRRRRQPRFLPHRHRADGRHCGIGANGCREYLGGAGVVASDPNWFSMATGMMSGSVFEGDPLSSFNISQVSTVLAYAEARATIVTSVLSLAGCFLSFAVVMLVFGTLTTITEWNHIHAKNSDKIEVPVHLPDLHAHLRPHRPHCCLQEGRVEADHA